MEESPLSSSHTKSAEVQMEPNLLLLFLFLMRGYILSQGWGTTDTENHGLKTDRITALYVNV